MPQTLEELKAENLAADEANQDEVKEPEVKTLDDELVAELKIDKPDDKPKEEVGPDGEKIISDKSAEGDEAWMQSDKQRSEEDDDADDSEKKFTDGDVAAARRKLKGKLQEKTDESDEWKEKYEKLKAEGGSPEEKLDLAPEKNRMPKLSDLLTMKTSTVRLWRVGFSIMLESQTRN